jgi:hypothetical protein
MYINCKNCHQTFSGHYCNNCGQTAETHKLNLHYLWHDIQHGIFHFDNGILYTAKQLFTRPGHSIREFIEGKRVKHFKPISLIVVLATAYIALIHFLHIELFIKTSETAIANSRIDIDQLKEWMTSHFAWITLLSIPLHTIGTAICFRKQGYNFIEYFVLNTYKAAQKICIAILFVPLLYHYSGTSAIETVTKTLIFIDFILYFWTNVQFFNYLSKTKTFFLTLLTHAIFWMLIILIITISVIIVAVF